MITSIRTLPPEEIMALTPQEFNLAPVFDRLRQYASPGGALLLADVDGNPAAAAALRLEGDTLHVDHFAVSPHYRGKGLGSKLLRACIDHAHAAGAARLRALTPAWCPDWRAFFTRHGFRFLDEGKADSKTDMTPIELRLDPR